MSLEDVVRGLQKCRQCGHTHDSCSLSELSACIYDDLREEPESWKNLVDYHYDIFRRRGIRIGKESDVTWVFLTDWW